jgi:hypothetical protein
MKDPQSSKAQTGNNIVLAGVILQTIWFVFFVICGVCFHHRMPAYPNNKVATWPQIRWQQYLLSLYLVSGLVLIRSIFRLAEFAQGHDGYIQRTESLLYVSDALPMLGLLSWMNWQHPSEIALLLRRQQDNSSSAREALRMVP